MHLNTKKEQLYPDLESNYISFKSSFQDSYDGPLEVHRNKNYAVYWNYFTSFCKQIYIAVVRGPLHIL